MHEWASLWPAKISVACICQMVTCTIETSDIHLNLSLLLPYVQIFHVSLYIYIYAMHLSLSNHCGLRGILLVSLKVFKLVKIHVTSCRKKAVQEYICTNSFFVLNIPLCLVLMILAFCVISGIQSSGCLMCLLLLLIWSWN